MKKLLRGCKSLWKRSAGFKLLVIAAVIAICYAAYYYHNTYYVDSEPLREMLAMDENTPEPANVENDPSVPDEPDAYDYYAGSVTYRDSFSRERTLYFYYSVAAARTLTFDNYPQFILEQNETVAARLYKELYFCVGTPTVVSWDNAYTGEELTENFADVFPNASSAAS